MSEKLNQNDLSTPRCREIAAARQAQGIPKSDGWLHLKFNMSTLKRNRAKTGKCTCKHHFSGDYLKLLGVCSCWDLCVGPLVAFLGALYQNDE